MMENRKKSFNIIDVAIVCILILAVLAFAYKFLYAQKKLSVNNKKAEYTMLIRGVREVSYNSLNVGDIFTDVKTNDKMGKIINKTKSPAEDFLTKADGNVVMAQKPDRLDVYLSIETEGSLTDAGFKSDGKQDLRKGAQLYLKSNRIAVQGEIIDLKLK